MMMKAMDDYTAADEGRNILTPLSLCSSCRSLARSVGRSSFLLSFLRPAAAASSSIYHPRQGKKRFRQAPTPSFFSDIIGGVYSSPFWGTDDGDKRCWAALLLIFYF